MSKMNLIAATFSSLEIIAASDDHPNKMKFSGTLVRLDEASTKPPNGSRGHKILIPKALAEKTYKTLVGMGVNYHPKLESHQPTRKVGIIKKAWIEGNAIKVSGIIWKKDFPDAEKDLKQANLGMSFEASDIDVEDQDADIWRLSGLCFTGAAILYKASAAYFKTEALAASAMSAKLITTINGGEQMANVAKTKKKTSDVAASGGLDTSALVKALTQANRPILDAITTMAANMAEERAERSVNIAEAILAKAKKAAPADADDDEDDDDDDEDMDSSEDVDAEEDMDEPVIKGKGKKKVAAAEAEDEDASADDEDELEDLDDENNVDEDQTGKINNKAVKVKKGDKTTVTTGGPHKTVKAERDLAKIAAAVDQLVEQGAAKDREIAKLKKKVSGHAAALEAAGEKTDRRSYTMSIPLTNLLAKNNVDPITLSAGGEKMSVQEFDAMAKAANISTLQSTAMKTEAARLGIMDEGIVSRS